VRLRGRVAIYDSERDRMMPSEKYTRPASNKKEPSRTSSMRIVKICCIFMPSYDEDTYKIRYSHQLP
jgi:hypothetical protein